MSSMWRLSIPLVLALATGAGLAAGSIAQQTAAPRYAPVARPAPSASVSMAVGEWRRLRTMGGYSFADYARFVIANPGWPGETAFRRQAERLMRPGEHPATVTAFFATKPPLTATGRARLAEALLATGRTVEARAAAREAFAASGLAPADEAALIARFPMTTADYDARVDQLLFDKDASAAYRLLPWTGAARRGAFGARIAMQSRAPNAEQLYSAVAGQVTADAGLMMDRARYLRDAGWETAARQLFARSHNFTHRPADPARFYEMMLLLARGASADRQHQLAYDIARQVDDSFAPGTDISLKDLAVRDHYTSLTWLAGSTALQRLRRPASAIQLFQRYGRGGRSLQVATKGLYWAGRAAGEAGQPAQASTFFTNASQHPDQFYGQLALERLGRRVPPPGGLPTMLVTDAQRRDFGNKRLVQAVEIVGRYGNRSEQALFVRALAESLTSDAERVLASELASRIGRQDLAVWTARAARNNGDSFYVRNAYPTLPGGLDDGRLWSIAHGIARQESSFDRSAISHAGARGMMQLMLPTAREQAGKMGLAYNGERLLSDPRYNIMLGSAYFARLLGRWDGNYPLAVASYNAGAGNVSKWVRAYGDPRTGSVDIVQWIEAIPFMETRGYVQRVLENTVVYDQLNPHNRPVGTRQLSQYLGKARPG